MNKKEVERFLNLLSSCEKEAIMIFLSLGERDTMKIISNLTIVDGYCNNFSETCSLYTLGGLITVRTYSSLDGFPNYDFIPKYYLSKKGKDHQQKMLNIWINK